MAGATAVDYELQYATDASFASFVTNIDTAATTHQPTLDLPVSATIPVGSRYYWRVRACAGGVCSDYSPTWHVNVGRVRSDVNGDGYGDVVVGSPAFDSERGRFDVWSGGPGPDLLIAGGAAGPDPDENLGSSVAFVGDLNGDGFGDVAVGAEFSDASTTDGGRAYVHYGAAGPIFYGDTPDGILDGLVPGERFGIRLAGPGDLNGDGFDDLVVSAVFNDVAGTDAGRVYVYFGSSGGLFETTPDAVLDGSATGDFFGAVGEVGDLNGDGFADLVVGAFGADAFGTDVGEAHVFLGSPGSTLDTTVDAIVTGAANGDTFGYAVTGGDFNGDAFSDLAVSAFTSNAGAMLGGLVSVYFGSNPLETASDADLVGAANELLGGELRSGDVNGDGIGDLLVAAPYADYVDVYLGTSGSAFDTTPDGTLLGTTAGDRFGSGLGAPGDLNGDAICDVIVGAFQSDSAGPNAGQAYIYFGVAGASFDVTEDDVLTGTASSSFGWSVD